MKKELLKIELRYQDEPNGEHDSETRSKTITIGIYDTLEEAVEEGNKTMKVLSEYFDVRVEDRFAVRGLFGRPDRLVSNCCYTTKGVVYFANITTLNFDDISEAITEAFKARDRYKRYKESEDR